MYYTESIRASYALYIVHDVDVGWERLEPIVQQINTYFQVSAGADSHEEHKRKRRRNRKWFRLTETIYMKYSLASLVLINKKATSVNEVADERMFII